jgi:hypothetical protein
MLEVIEPFSETLTNLQSRYGMVSKRNPFLSILSANFSNECDELVRCSKANYLMRLFLFRSFRMTPLQLVEAQLAAYNSGNLDAFCDNFAEDVEVYDGMGRDAKLVLKGMEEYRRRYAQRLAKNLSDDSTPDDNSPDGAGSSLHAEIVNRICLGNVVIDHERVTGLAEDAVEVLAIYHVVDELIARVYFVNRT